MSKYNFFPNECQTLMTKFDDKIFPRRTAAPPSGSSEYNNVSPENDMYTVAKKVRQSVCCVVSCY